MSDDLRFGYLCCQQTRDDAARVSLLDEIAAEAQAAERAGFDGVFVSEHHQTSDNFFPSPLVLAAALARETTTLDIGATVAVLPLYHPVRLVEDATCVDLLSKGRFILGVGPGYVPRDFDLYGFAREEAAARYREALEIVAHGWDRDWVHEGEWYRARIGEITPRPVSDPRPPLWLAGGKPAGVRRAARYGDAWVIGARSTFSACRELASAYRAACAEEGREPRVAVIRDGWVADTAEAAHAEVSDGLLAAYDQRVKAGFIRDSLLAELGIDDLSKASIEQFYELAREWWLIGDAEMVADQIARWREEVGASYVIVRFRHPTGPSHQAVTDQIERFSEEVLEAHRGHAKGEVHAAGS